TMENDLRVCGTSYPAGSPPTLPSLLLSELSFLRCILPGIPRFVPRAYICRPLDRMIAAHRCSAGLLIPNLDRMRDLICGSNQFLPGLRAYRLSGNDGSGCSVAIRPFPRRLGQRTTTPSL